MHICMWIISDTTLLPDDLERELNELLAEVQPGDILPSVSSKHIIHQGSVLCDNPPFSNYDLLFNPFSAIVTYTYSISSPSSGLHVVWITL